LRKPKCSCMRNVEIILAEISESLDRIARKVEGRAFDSFVRDTDAQDVVCWNVSRIGEAVKQVPDEFRKKHSEVPWKQMAGMRDVLIHQYYRIDIEELWRTASKEAVALKSMIDACLADLIRSDKTCDDSSPMVRESGAAYKVSRKRKRKKQK
jgi:uncharacterized protein with HEPN domain